nr:uncharacterized protein LOC103226108 isoform X2 [Chlorocebus sabaeus]
MMFNRPPPRRKLRLELWVLGRKATEIVDHFHHVLSKCHMLMSSLQSRSCEAPASPEGSLAASPAELSLQRQLKCTQKPPLAILHVDQSLELQCPGQEINEISPAKKDYKNVNLGFVKRAHLFWSTICFFAPQVETAYLRHAEVVCDYPKETTRKIPQAGIQGRLQAAIANDYSFHEECTDGSILTASLERWNMDHVLMTEFARFINF